MSGDIFCFDGALYMYGGMPTDMFVTGVFNRPYYGSADPYMFKLHHETDSWEPVSFDGAPAESWTYKQVFSKGVPNQNPFCLLVLL